MGGLREAPCSGLVAGSPEAEASLGRIAGARSALWKEEPVTQDKPPPGACGFRLSRRNLYAVCLCLCVTATSGLGACSRNLEDTAPPLIPAISQSTTTGTRPTPAPPGEAQSGKESVNESPSVVEEQVGARAFEAPIPESGEVAERLGQSVPVSWGMDVQGVLTRMDSDSVALTLDACGGAGGSGYDAELIDGLVARGVPATLFLNQRWIEANPDLAQELAANPLFEIANHGTSHRPLSVDGRSAYGIPGTASAFEAAQEVRGNHLAITGLQGYAPRYFRSGTAHYDEVAVKVVDAFNEAPLGFTVNADAGATLDAATIREQVTQAAPGSIIIAHMNQPHGQTAEGILAGVDDLIARGIRLSLVENPR